MSRFGGPRSSASHLDYGDDRGGHDRGGQRWDPERFSRERDRLERFGRQGGQDRDRFEDHGRRFGGEETDRFDRFDRSGGDGYRRGGGGGPGRRRDSSADDLGYGGRGGRGGRGDDHFEERIIIDEKFARPNRRQPAYYDEGRDSHNNSPSQSIVPFNRSRRQSVTVEKDFGPPARRPARPGFLRRQSSLDTFDRRPMPRYERELEREIIPIPVPRRPRRSPPRRAPPRRFEERDFEEIRIAEPDYYGDEEFREIRERDIIRDRRRSTSRFRVQESIRGFSDDERDDFEPERKFPRRGKTRMPKRVVSTRAVIELGYPYEEEHDTIIILKALGKEHIDEIIKVSKELKDSGGAVESRTTYMIEGPPPEPSGHFSPPPPPAGHFSPPPPPPASVHSFHPPPPPASVHSFHPPAPPQPEVITLPPPPPPEVIFMPAPPPPPPPMSPHQQPEIIERRTEIVMSPPPPPPSAFHPPPPMPVPMDHQVPESVANWDVISQHSNQPPPRARSHSQGAHSHHSHHTQRHRSHSRRRKGDREYTEKEESNAIGLPLSLVLPDRRKNEQSIKAEIRALEAEKKALKLEREAEKQERKADRYRESEHSSDRRDSGTVKIEKDRKARNTDPRLIKAMLATLT